MKGRLQEYFVCLKIVLDKLYAAVAEELDSRTSRPGPESITFEITDAQIVHDGDEKYVVCTLYSKTLLKYVLDYVNFLE